MQVRVSARARWRRARLVMDHYPQVNGVCMYLFMSSSAWPLAVWQWLFPPIALTLAVFVFCRRAHTPLHPCCLARLPKDPVAYVRRHARGLRVMHTLWAKPYRLVAAAASYVAFVVMFLVWVPLPVNTLTSLLVPAFIIAPLSVGVHLAEIHRNCLWWCPECRRGGGGNDDDQVPEPDPDPVPVGTKELQPA